MREQYEPLGVSELASMCHHRDATIAQQREDLSECQKEIARLAAENAKLREKCGEDAV